MRKTHSSAKKRFKVSGTGKIRAHAMGKRHLMTGKGGARVRRMRKWITLEGGIAKQMKRLLGV